MGDRTQGQIHRFYLIAEDAQGREVLRQPLVDPSDLVSEDSEEAGRPINWFPLMLVGLDRTGEIWALINKSGVWQPVEYQCTSRTILSVVVSVSHSDYSARLKAKLAPYHLGHPQCCDNYTQASDGGFLFHRVFQRVPTTTSQPLLKVRR